MEVITRDQGALKENVNLIFFLITLGEHQVNLSSSMHFPSFSFLSEDSQQNCATQRFSFPQNCSER